MSLSTRRAFLGTLGAAAVAVPEKRIVPVAAIHGGTVVRIDPTVHETVAHAGVRV